MINTELSSIMATSGRVVEWANKVRYQADLTPEDKEISSVIDAWAKELGRTGCDPNHEVAQMITKAITPEVVLAPSSLMDALFNEGNIGEFDDIRGEVSPKNTIRVHNSIYGGNVDRSFIDFTKVEPTWTNLQAETDIPLAELRRGGYKTIATYTTLINEAFEQKKIAAVTQALDSAITNSMDNYISEASANPTETSMKALALYLSDYSDGSAPVAFGLSKYIQAICGLTGVTTYLNDRVKDMYNTTGFVKEYAGLQLLPVPTFKKLADGSNLIPNQRVFGVSGKIGDCITRGTTNVFEETDINSEKLHIKVNGYQFGTMITELNKAAKIVMAL